MADRVGQIYGNYQLLRLLGRGAFADVYLAEHRYLEVPAAIKILHVRMEPDTQGQFLREARIIAHLQNPHIVRILDFGFQDQTPYLVMEYTPNGTLRTRHPQGMRLPLNQIVSYVKQLAPALDYAHQQRVIHRDVKPDNMLLSANDEVLLSDFGIAVVQQSMDSFKTQGQAGTPIYMAPEQIQGKPSTASDQYALGVIVYEWLCGEPPFRGTLFEVLSQHLYHPPPSLCARIPFLPLAVEDAVFGALAKEPNARFVTVQEFADVLEEVSDTTQPLLFRVPSGKQSEELGSLSDTLPYPVLAPPPGEADRSTVTTQMLAIVRNRAQDKEERLASYQHVVVSVSETNRQRLLKKVRSFWITGVLEHSLHGNALVALGLEEQPDAVAHPWQLVLHHSTGAPHPLPANTHITEVYDKANGELLILGAPGSGKTTLLLEVARELLVRAERDEQHPMPVVFNLSSWAIKQQHLADWLVEQLNQIYQVPRKLGQMLVDMDQLLPLLDGLDEVAPKDRTACIEAINTYRQEHGLLPLVVCSRSADYMTQTARIQLDTAVAVQPLTELQVDEYLAHAGEPLRALRVALHQDPALRELTSTPLMLSILALTYHGLPVEELLRGASLTERQRQVFESYVERMLRYRSTERRSTPEQTTHWLSWLAMQMKRQNQTVFYIEQLQFEWLTGDRAKQAYDWLGVRLPGILIGALVGLAVISFLNFVDLSFSIVSMLFGGLLGELWCEGRVTQKLIISDGKDRSKLWLRILLWLGTGVIIGLIFSFVIQLNLQPQFQANALSLSESQLQIVGLTSLLSTGLAFGLWNVLLRLLYRQGSPEKNSQSTLSTMWQRLSHFIRSPGASNGLVTAMLLVAIWGTIGTLVYGLILSLVIESAVGLVIGLALGLFSSMAIGLLLGPCSGFISVLLMGKSVLVQPVDQLNWSWGNLGKALFSKQHIRPTVVVGLFFGLVALLISVSLQVLLAKLTFRLIYLENGLIFGLINGLSCALGYWLLLGSWQSVSSATIEDRRRAVPNQGIRRSAYNGLALGLVSALVVGLTAVLRQWLIGNLVVAPNVGYLAQLFSGLETSNPSAWLRSGLLAGLCAGLIAGLINGGLACLRHYILRFMLWRSGSAPWHYVRFLDYTARSILLRKVGGGYIFIHRLLLEYFASLASTKTPDVTQAQKRRNLPVL